MIGTRRPNLPGAVSFVSLGCSALALAATIAFPSISTAAPQSPTPTPIDLARQARLLLSDRCFPCHGPDEAARKGNLRLDVPEGVFGSRPGLPKGVVIPGDAGSSELLYRILAEDDFDRMPPPAANLALTEPERELLRRWIDEGAPFGTHWAFQQIAPAPVPPAVSAPPTGHPIDAFIAARLEQEGLGLSPEATREVLIRRLSLNLTGLPPTLEAVDAFVTDVSPNAYEKAVDRLLASPAYAEQRTREWLDLARYADTYGYQADVERDLSPWRDWVIRAFDENLPYDEFITWQLAGDLLPNATREQILATAFNRLHRQTNEGGSIEEEFRAEYAADRVHTVSTALLGLTMDCARCHDHKFDPITQKDFYRMFAFFNNIDESGLYSHFTQAVPSPTLLLYPQEVQAKHESLQTRIRELEAVEEQTSPELLAHFEFWMQSGAARVSPPVPVAHFAFDAVETNSTPDSLNLGQGAQLIEEPSLTNGQSGHALLFSGDNSLLAPHAGQFNRTTPFSLSLWIHPSETQERAVVLHRSRAWTDSGSRGYELVLDSMRPSFALIHFWPGNALKVSTPRELPVGQWSHLTVTYDGSSRARGLRLYLHGDPLPTEVVRDHLFKDILHRSEWGDADVGNIHLTLAGRFRD